MCFSASTGVLQPFRTYLATVCFIFFLVLQRIGLPLLIHHFAWELHIDAGCRERPTSSFVPCRTMCVANEWRREQTVAPRSEASVKPGYEFKAPSKGGYHVAGH